MSTPDRHALLAVWSRLDLTRAVLPADRAIIEGSTSPRTLIVDLALAGGDEEIYDACAVLGRLLAQRGGSPTLASATIDHAAEALGVPGAPWVVTARASLAEGFVSALVEATRHQAMQAWEFPSCTVPLGEGAMAIAAGHPSDDEEVLSGWSARGQGSGAARCAPRGRVGRRSRCILPGRRPSAGGHRGSTRQSLSRPRRYEGSRT